MVSDQSKMQGNNSHRRHIPLYCNQSSEPTQNESEAELSDFPPIKERNSTPPSPAPSVPARSRYLPQAARRYPQQHPLSSEEEPQSQRHRQPKTGLGQTNMLNTVDAISPVQHAKVTPYIFVAHSVFDVHSLQALKRDSGVQDVGHERPFKKQRVAFHEEDVDWMRAMQHEITGVKESLEKIAAEAREDRRDISSMLQELLRELIRQRS
jgi:hypothetical protein